MRALEMGAQVIQSRPPVEALHYVTVLNEDVMQAVIYDGNTKDARLMGVEYTISESLFNTLPPEEKKFWHSHHYAVKSGNLVAPGLPTVAVKALMFKSAIVTGI